MSQTPAQASGRYDFVTDVPIQGPTDPGMRAAACWWTQNVLPVEKPACVDCKGPIPMWAKNPTAWGGEAINYGGGCSQGWGGQQVWHGRGRYRDEGDFGERGRERQLRRSYGMGAAGDPAATLSSDQTSWVTTTLTTLNQQITSANPGNTCAGWQDPSTNLSAAVTCFQLWYNANASGTLRTDGVLDSDTIAALVGTTSAHPTDFTAQFPGGLASLATAAAAAPAPVAPIGPPAPVAPIGPPAPDATAKHEKKGMSTGAKVGIGVGAAVVVGAVAFVFIKKRKGAHR